MNQIAITQGASSDISKLAQSNDRAAVALSALSEENLTPRPIADLQELLANHTGTSAPTTLTTEAFSTVYTGNHCQLAIRQTELGREVQLTLSAGSSLRMAFNEINAKSQERYGRDAIYQGQLFEDRGLDEVAQEVRVHTFIPVINDSLDRDRPQHAEFLKGLNLDWVDLPLLVAAAGAFRIEHGFGGSIGSSTDKGDLFNSKVVRARSGTVMTHDIGVIVMDYNDGASTGALGVGGRSTHESKT